MAFTHSDTIRPFDEHIYLSSPTMHGEESSYMMKAYETNWMSTVGENIDEIERQAASYIGVRHAVALSCGTSALHLAAKLAGEKLYGQAKPHQGTLQGRKVLACDMTFDATINPIAYEDGQAVFIDSEYDTWNMDPEALEKAFELYPEARLVFMVHLYGTPARVQEIREICSRHGALLVEDAAESFGAKYLLNGEWKETGNLADYGCLSFNGNKIITGSSGGMFLTDSEEDADRVRKWSTQSREDALWYQHEEIGYNYRMSNVIAGVVRGQLPHLDEHIAQKKAIYERYREGFRDLPVKMNPYDSETSQPNFWLSCLLIDKDAMCKQVRGERDCLFLPESGKTCPTEILQVLQQHNVESRPIWKPMHMQPIYRMNPFITRTGSGRAVSNAYIQGEKAVDVGADIFQRGLCLPSDNKMTPDQQDRIIELIHRCFE